MWIPPGRGYFEWFCLCLVFLSLLCWINALSFPQPHIHPPPKTYLRGHVSSNIYHKILFLPQWNPFWSRSGHSSAFSHPLWTPWSLKGHCFYSFISLLPIQDGGCLVHLLEPLPFAWGIEPASGYWWNECLCICLSNLTVSYGMGTSSLQISANWEWFLAEVHGLFTCGDQGAL